MVSSEGPLLACRQPPYGCLLTVFSQEKEEGRERSRGRGREVEGEGEKWRERERVLPLLIRPSFCQIRAVPHDFI